MILVAAVTAGVLFGAGTVAIVWGVRPPLARLDRQVDAVLAGRRAAVDSPWRRWHDRLAAGTPSTAMPDLALLGRTAEDFVVSRLLWAAGGLLIATVLGGVAGVAPTMLPLAATVGALTGWMLAVQVLHDQAAKARRTLALALAAWTQMAALMIRAGIKDEQAMRRAAAAGDHWTFRMLAAAMDRAVADQAELWSGLEDLGHEVDVMEIRQLAAELRLTETAGGTPTEALLARADALRQDELANQLTAAKAAGSSRTSSWARSASSWSSTSSTRPSAPCSTAERQGAGPRRVSNLRKENTMLLPRVRTSARRLLMVAVMLPAVLSAPTTTLWNGVSRHARRLQEEDGEIVQNILWVAGFAAIAIAVVAIIRTFVITEAQNLPTSGG